MSRRYGEPIVVRVEGGRPIAFTWRGRHYPVTVIGTWQLKAHWWGPETAAGRTNYRVQTPSWGVFGLYHDAVRGAWVLDICQD